MEENHAYQDNRPCKSRSYTLPALVAIALLLVAIGTFRGFKIELDTFDGSVTAVSSRWWGLWKRRVEIRWMQPRGYESPAWCAEDAKGEWYPFFVEGPDPVDDYNGYEPF